MRLAALLFMVLATGACASLSSSHADELTVEGLVTVRGHEPFAVLVLETAHRNSYVLDIPEDERIRLQNAAPGHFRISGNTFLAEWYGRPYTHLRVRLWEPAAP
jgi:hypothetical protein